MTTLQTNIDDVRAEIMRLESAPIFDAMAWSRVLAAMSDRPAGLADAKRRMETAMGNQVTVGIDLANGPNDCVRRMIVKTDLGWEGNEIELKLVRVLPWDGVIIEYPDVSVETGE